MLDYQVNKGISQTILSVQLGDTKPVEEFRYRMLKENTISGITPLNRKMENEKLTYDYDITGLQSMERMYQSKKFSYQEIRHLYSGIITILLRAEEYFLDSGSFILTTQFVCFKEMSNEYSLVYCPEYHEDSKAQMEQFTEFVMNHVNYQDKLAVEMTYELFRLLRDDHTTLKEILCYVESGRKKQPSPIVYEQPPVGMPGNNIGQNNMQQNKMQIGNMPLGPKVQPYQNSKKDKESKKDSVSTKKIVLSAVSVGVGIIVFLLCYLSGVLYADGTKKLDTTKFAGILLLIGVCVGYACYRINEMKESEQEKEPKPKKEKESNKKSKEMKKPDVIQPSPKPLQQAPQCIPPVPQPEAPRYENLQPQPLQQPMQKLVQEQRQQKQIRYCLVDQKAKSRQQFIIYKTPYVVGKSVEQADGVIYSDAVSRIHAEFIIENDKLYVIDMSSTNGTYVNQRKITSNEKIIIKEGDLITIADREYRLTS